MQVTQTMNRIKTTIPDFCFVCGDMVAKDEVKEQECCNCQPAKLPAIVEGHLHCWNCDTWYCNGVVEVLGCTRVWHAQNVIKYDVKDLARLASIIKNDAKYTKSLSNSFLEVVDFLSAIPNDIKRKIDGD